ncbi:50S ribosomal protein L6 [Candidatus Berkelbacteria bacterium RIFCSPLOWO2_01_FULL_50_28]|uniref:50S ribosomal protein L6 n=1 Tax=Candidatus Berkelbacteria bacterium RIFCSPLOWO2_01_FULL_50_28 TaxID=1797471 RepID=A0A1F5EBW3_9BACT|nr:MAG: 50S ribosomal protein L6 [Candidatus Berkelbacteria bacterium RIFCSPHIGHO2_12_FULL_50_11]OGD64902.1 MAG: 50S ribosomal protein L6 [Candidatus Berkelbacteria bacterium RIFCSPLOWO2_01_FULL_50_28]
MSRIGIKQLKLESDVTVEIQDKKMVIKGSLGELEVAIPHGIQVKNTDGILAVTRVNESRSSRELHGTVRKLLENAVIGVSKGFEKRLDLIGIGYRASIEDGTLTLLVGYTHPVKLVVPEAISARVEKNTIVLNSYNKIQLGEFAANIRKVRSPEPYKGKGIRYAGEIVRLKAGKAVKTGA